MRASLRLAFVLIALLAAAPLAAQPVHSVWSDKPIAIADGDTGAWYSPTSGNSVSSWQEKTLQAFSNAIGFVGATQYEFRLISVGSSDNDEIIGLWDVYRNGSLRCASCVGKAYGLSQAAGVGNYFKIYVGSPTCYAENWHYSGYIAARFDY